MHGFRQAVQSREVYTRVDQHKYVHFPVGSYTAVGFPPGTAGTSIIGVILNSRLGCSTQRFGRHVIVQFTRLRPPAPPPAPVPPTPPPPPPSLGAVKSITPGEAHTPHVHVHTTQHALMQDGMGVLIHRRVAVTIYNSRE